MAPGTNSIHSIFRSLLLVIVVGIPLMSHAGIDRQRQSVVKIFVTIQQEDFRQPWQSSPPMSGSGSGFIIKGKRLMTNAHVVSDARFIEVQREGDTRKFPAVVRFIAHDCDIAVLEVKDEAFFEDTKPLEFGSTLPSLNDSVIVLGYPMGGDRMSLTKGVVSRIDFRPYSHTGVQFVPLGGVSAATLKEYLAAPGVAAVGGSWIADRSLIKAGDWSGITALARKAVAIASGREEEGALE